MMEMQYDFEVKIRYKGLMDLTEEEYDYYLEIEDSYEKAMFVVERSDLTEIYVNEFKIVKGE